MRRASTAALAWFNALPTAEAERELSACCASRAFARTVASGRPYGDRDALDAAADAALHALTWDDVEEALAAHPRIGQRVDGRDREASWSRGEQSGTRQASPQTLAALTEGNVAYEERFGHVFLICASGLTAARMLSELRARLANDPETERRVVHEELAKITRLRLERLLHMGITLGPNQYGKAETRLVRLTRDGDRHQIKDVNVSVVLAGDMTDAHLSGNNANVLPTDTQKNTVYAFAKEHGLGEIEDFATRLARHFVDTQSPVHRARVSVEEYLWDRLPATGHSFVRSGREERTAVVTYDGRTTWVVSGLRNMVVLNSTGSEFWGFAKDRYTTLAETEDRILATAVDARWRHGADTGDWGTSYEETRRHLLEAFADTYSYSLQQTLYAMGRRVLEHRPEIVEVRLSLPNKHHFLVDLAPFGLDNAGEVFYATDRPYGLIEGTLTRDGAPPAGSAW